MIHIQHKTDCSGCGGCRQACPNDCITYRPDGEGFFYPEVDESRCSGCGKCERVCPMLSAAEQDFFPETFACRNEDAAIRSESSSGGVFTALAAQTLRDGGVVFGALLREDGSIAHAAVTEPDELARLRGSKYVQSDMGDCFREAKEYLDAGRRVLFSGTPCQIYGLSCFLSKPYANLLLVDTVCMGVPSPGIWDRYRHAREAAADSRITAVSFRDKATGWRDYSMRLAFENGTQYSVPRLKDPYLACFLKRVDLRPACHECRFKGTARRSDLTLGDYWGFEGLFPDWDDDRGVSLLLVNTKKGSEWLARSKRGLELRPTPYEHAVQTHPSLVRSIPADSRRDKFFAAAEQSEDILATLRRYGSPTPTEMLRRAAGKLLRTLGLRK